MSAVKRPSKFDDIIGQSEVISRLKINISGAKAGNSTLDHVLLDGPPGLGKTTIAQAIASELNENLYIANAANIRNIKKILPYLEGIAPRSVLFIDEIHRLPKLVEEFLYPVMEDFQINFVNDSVVESIDIPRFTLVGATTSGGSLSQPFYDRFLIKEHLYFYSDDELAKLAGLNAQKLGLMIAESDLLEIAKRSKGTPRILNSRLAWYKNYLIYHNKKKVDIHEVFSEQGIDENGFDKNDRLYIDLLKKHKNNPLGIKAISSVTGLSMETIENNIEPFLVRKGYVIRTQKGRILSNV